MSSVYSYQSPHYGWCDGRAKTLLSGCGSEDADQFVSKIQRVTGKASRLSDSIVWMISPSRAVCDSAILWSHTVGCDNFLNCDLARCLSLWTTIIIYSIISQSRLYPVITSRKCWCDNSHWNWCTTTFTFFGGVELHWHSRQKVLEWMRMDSSYTLSRWNLTTLHLQFPRTCETSLRWSRTNTIWMNILSITCIQTGFSVVRNLWHILFSIFGLLSRL